MKSFQGSSSNINSPIMGVVTRHTSRSWFKRKSNVEILCVNERSGNLPKADAYIFADESISPPHISVPLIRGLKQSDLSSLNDGDVVLLSQDGKVNVIYDITSSHNAIFATNRCNLHCLMCPQPSSSDPENILKNNLLLIQMMNPEKTSHVAITGGEPTTLGDGLLELIQSCKKYLPKTALVVLTNGRKLADMEFVRRIALLNHPDLVFAVPLYSDNDTIHDLIVGVPGAFYETIKGLHNLALFKYRVEIRNVIHALNSDRLLQLSEFIYHNLPFTSHVAFMALEMTGLARNNADKLWIDPYDYSSQLVNAVRYLHRADMNVSIYNHQLCTLPTSMWPFSRKSISEWKNSFLKECDECMQKDNCGGFFETGNGFYSKHIRHLEKRV